MLKTILMTSFTTWEPHQASNASDDLLELISATISHTTHVLRRLPVDSELAPRQVIATLDKLRPEVTLLCGMAEKRRKLYLESNAVEGNRVLRTRIDLEVLTKDLTVTEISHDAGRFVCNETYFKVLSHVEENGLNTRCLFAHVPPLTGAICRPILADFKKILRRLP